MPAPVPGGNIPLPWWAQATRAASAAGMRQRVDNNGD